MILISYETSNWGPHKYQKIEFPKGAKTIALCADNDQGKSWILRGIGFTLSIGRNEYGDQTSIHEGEIEAYHKLIIEHKKETHTVEKIVKGKNSEEEGTTTIINGNKTDRAGYEEFYNKTLGMPHPTIWLPIVISMQNQTDFHLRSKKSDREEALRAACQLTKIDNWKDALQSKTNEEDKKLLQESSALKSKIETLQKEVSTQKATEETLITQLSTLGDPNKILTNKELFVAVSYYETKISEEKSLVLEKENIDREMQLLLNSIARTEEELVLLLNPNNNKKGQKIVTELEIDSLEKKKDELAAETNARAKENNLKTFQKITKEIKENQKKKEEIGETLSLIVLEEMEESLNKFKNITKKLNECKEKLQQLSLETNINVTELEENDNYEQILKTEEEKIQQTQELANELWGNLSQAIKKQKELTNAIDKQEESSSPYLLKKSIEKEIKDIEEISNKKIDEEKEEVSDREAQDLLRRTLKHWDTHPHKDCPLCCQDLDKVKTFQNKTIREAVLKELEQNKKEQIENSEELKRKLEELKKRLLKVTELIETNETIETIKESSKEICNKANHEEIEAELKVIIQNSFTIKIKIEQILENLKKLATSQSEEKITKRLLEEIIGGKITKMSIEKIDEWFKKERENYHTIALINSEIRSLEKEKERVLEELDRLEHYPEPSTHPDIKNLTIQEIKNQTKEISEKIQIYKKNKSLIASKEKEKEEAIVKHKTIFKTAGDAQKKLDTIKKECGEGAGMPTPTNFINKVESSKWEEINNFWRKQEKEIIKIENLLEEIPKKVKEVEAQIEETYKILESTNIQVRKAQAARKLISFLDYKHAPRKLLQNITEKLFKVTNKIGEALEVDIKLEVGKNLEFLSKQKRAGKLIEQKTERLGFGKGAILGICFRLACQKLLLPETGFLILDEPTANVDLKRKSALKNFLKNLGEETESKTKQIILIEHDQDFIELCEAKIHIKETT